MNHKNISFKPIPAMSKDQFAALTIHPPGTFIDNKDYIVFVGGCGVGHATSLKEAKQMLLERAKQYCANRITEAERKLRHYREQLAVLEKEGLQK